MFFNCTNMFIFLELYIGRSVIVLGIVHVFYLMLCIRGRLQPFSSIFGTIIQNTILLNVSCVKVKLICVLSEKKNDFTLLIKSIKKWDLTL